MPDPRDALDAIGTLPDTEIDIGDAALQFARIDAPEADWEAARAHLTELARAAAALAETIDAENLAARAVGLSGLLGGRFGYRGDEQTYDDLANANLIRVIERRRGLPVALGILWLHTAQAAGWEAHGVGIRSILPQNYGRALHTPPCRAPLFIEGTPAPRVDSPL